MNASKRLPSALLLTALCTTSAWAAELPATVVTTNKIGSVDVEYRWNYTIDTTTRTATFESVEPDPFGDLTLDSVLTDGGRVYTVKKLREGALANAQGLTSVTLPAMLAEVGPFAFSNCTSLATVTIPEGVRYIGERAFVNTALTQIDLPSTLLDMGGNIAAGSLYTATINIGDSSHFTYSEDGVLYNRDMTKLYACPSRAEGTITIPDTVTNICADAFFGCFRLAYLNLPENVNTIGSGAFNVRGIWDGVGASEASAKLTSIFYNGDRPNAPSDIYEGTPSTLVSYAFTDSWAGLTTWMGRGVNTIDGTNPPILSYKDANGITWHYRIIGGSAEIYNEDRNGKPIAAITPTSTTGSSYTIEDESGNPVHASALRIPANINGYAVTRIGDHAFDGCSALPYIGIPSSVLSIGDYAFAGCTAVKAIAAAADVPFAATDGTITIPSGVTTIGYHALEGSKASTVSLPYTITALDGNPVAGCDFVGTLEIDASCPKFYSTGNIIYNKKQTALIAVPANYDSTSLTLLSTATEIGPEALFGCENIDTITLPDSLKIIDRSAFSGCSSIVNISIPAAVSEIRETAFNGCTSLVRVTFAGNAPTAALDIYDGSPSVTTYAKAASSGWTTGTWCGRPIVFTGDDDMDGGDEFSVTENGITWYFRGADGVAEIYRDGGTAVSSESPITALTLPTTLAGYLIKGLGEGALSGLRGITSIAVPDTYEWVEANAFAGCSSLASVSLPEGITRIGDNAFANTSLAEIKLPSTVKTIGKAPFDGTNITSLEIPRSTTALNGNPGAGCINLAQYTVADGNRSFKAEGDLLFNYRKTELIACQAYAEEVIVPNSVTAISEGAFSCCLDLIKVTYLGNAPTCDDGLYDDAPDVVSYASENAQGWTTTTWKNRPIVLSSEGGTSADLYSYDDGTVTWYFRVLDGVAEIYKDGDTAVVSDSGETLLTITLPDSLGGYPVYGIGDGALSNLKGITSVTVPERYQWIGDNVFSNCTALASVSLGEGLEELGATPFTETHVTDLTIPAGVQTIIGNPLIGAPRGTAISVDAGNPFFASVDGVLYNKDVTTLIAAPATISAVTIPDTVTTIADDALNGCLVLSKLSIPISVTTIGERAFANCSALAKVSYAGNAPEAADSIYDGSDNVISYANEDAVGWTTTTWKDRPIVLVSDGSAGSEELCYDDGTTTWYFRIINGVAEIWREGPTTAVVNNDGSAITSLTLPDTLGGYVVKGIGNCAMANLQGITTITIPETYAWIGDFAFSNCTSLASCEFNADYVELGTLPFYGTRIATTGSVTDENGVTWDYEVTAAGAQITNVSGATGDVIIPARLGGYKVGGLNPDALNGCSGITSFASNAKALMVRDGVLYSADGSVLIRVPDTCSLGGTCTVETTKATFAEVTRSGTSSKSEYSAMVAKFKPTSESKVENTKDGTVTYSIVYQNTNTTNTTSKKFDVPGDIDLDSIIAGVTEIADYAFMGVGSLSGSANVTTNSTVTGTPRIESNYLEAPVTYTTTCVTSNYTYKLTVNPKSTVIGENAFAGIDVTPVYVEAPVVTLDGTTVDLSALFLRANSDSEIVANGIAVSGSVGKQKISADGGSVDVPAYYTATKTGSTVTLELNEKARPVIAGNSYEDAMIVSGSTVTIRLESSNPDLYYALGSSVALDGPWTVGEYVKGATSLKTAKPSGDSAFFKVFVTDIRP